MSYKLSRSALMILMTDFALRFHHERERKIATVCKASGQAVTTFEAAL
jgi:hypothetical protein